VIGEAGFPILIKIHESGSKRSKRLLFIARRSSDREPVVTSIQVNTASCPKPAMRHPATGLFLFFLLLAATHVLGSFPNSDHSYR